MLSNSLMRFSTLGLTCLAAFALCSTAAQAGIIPIGSSYTFIGTDAPNDFTATTTFSSTPVVVDDGAVTLSEDQVATGSNGEWDVFHMSTTNGGPLANDLSGYWDITIDYVLSSPVYFDGVVDQWTVNGTAVGPLTNGIGSICCASATNPVLPGWSYYNSGFSSALPAGTQTDWNQIYVTPYSYISAGGIDPSTANGFNFALHFTLQTPTVPEPASVGLLGAGMFALMLLRKKT
jgi:PEP-CTERM motif